MAVANTTSSRSPGVITSAPGLSRLIKWVIERAAISISLTRAECSRAGASTRAFRCWAMSSVRGAAKLLDSGMVPSSGRRRALAVAVSWAMSRV